MKRKRIIRKNKPGFFSDNYKKSWNYIKESGKFIWIVTGLFFFSVLLGFLFQPPSIINLISNYIKEVLAQTQKLAPINLMIFIFFNNIKVGFMGLLYGFLLGIFPLISIFVNGYVVGYVSSYAISSEGLVSLLNLLPHGIFELPAIFISLGMGVKFGTFLFYKEKMKKFSEFFVNSIRVFIFVILPLLLVAAIIEGILIFFLK